MKKKVYESPVTTCRQVLMEADVMQAASLIEGTNTLEAGHSQDGGVGFDDKSFELGADDFGW